MNVQNKNVLKNKVTRELKLSSLRGSFKYELTCSDNGEASKDFKT